MNTRSVYLTVNQSEQLIWLSLTKIKGSRGKRGYISSLRPTKGALNNFPLKSNAGAVVVYQ